MKLKNIKPVQVFTVAVLLFFTVFAASIVFSKPSFEVAPQKEPTVSSVSVAPASQDRGSSVVISSTITDVSGIDYAKAEIKNAANMTIATINLYDDGAHNDGSENDGVFANNWTIPISLAVGNYGVFIIASDTLGNVYQKSVADANLTVTASACVPTKTCADYPGQCGAALWDGCANMLDCSGSCVSQICCSGICATPTCKTSSDCDDSNDCTEDICNNPNTCSSSCSNSAITTCKIISDGCCPAVCNSGNDADCTASACTATCDFTKGECSSSVVENAAIDNSGVCCGGESCYQCDTGYSWDGSACIVSGCTETCSSLNYECGIHYICGISKDCGSSCVLPKTCSISGKCVDFSSPLVVEIINPKDTAKFTKGDLIGFRGYALGGKPGYTYEWSSDKEGKFSNDKQAWVDTNDLANPWSVGNHTITLTVKDSNGITATDSINIEVKASTALTVRIDAWRTEFSNSEWLAFCADTSGGISPYTFVWNNGITDFAINQCPNINLAVAPWTPGTYTIVVTAKDNVGNTATDTININIVDMTVDIWPQNGSHFSYGDSIWFSAFVLGGVAPYTYSWVSDLDGTIHTKASTMNNFDNWSKDNLQEGIHTITVTITDSSGTPITIVKTFKIQIDPPPLLTVSIDAPADGLSFVQGNDISFEGSYDGGVWPYTFTWSSNLDGVIYTDTLNPDFTKNNLSVGTHTITLAVDDGSGQIAKDSIDITINPSSSLTAVINSPVSGDTFQKIDDIIEFDGSASDGVNPYSYSWSSNIDGDITPASGATNKFSKNDLSTGNHTITLTITDNAGATATDSVNITVNAGCAVNNSKDNTKYSPKETFLIADTDWRSILSLVPIAVWNDGGTIKKHPALIYHYETNTAFDADSTIHFMQMYEPDHLTTIGSIPANLNNLFTAAEPVGAGMNAGDISNIQPSDYFSYWSSYDSLVVVDYDDYKAGLMASVFASHKNSPIIFVNSANLATYQAMINGKTVYAIGALDAATQSYISSNAGCEVDYTLEELQKWYATETNSDKLILVNPNDLSIELNNIFTPYITEKSGAVSRTFGKMSLSSPFLSSFKQEVIAYTELPDSGSNESCSSNANISSNIIQADSDAANAIKNLFTASPEFFTIIASPKAIPDSKYKSCDDIGVWQLRTLEDYKYAQTVNANTYSSSDPKTGRIYGITISDASSYIARSTNFDYLNNKIYSGNYSSISIGLSFSSFRNIAKEIKDKTFDSGYASSCFTDLYKANCTLNAKPPFNNYKLKNYISYNGHGSPYSWGNSTMRYNEIPLLDLSIVTAVACLTNNFWQYSNQNFGAHMIRRGAISYIGSTGITTTMTYSVAKDAIKALGKSSTVTLGEMYYETQKNFYDPDYNMLGDPTLQPKLKQISW